MIIESIVSTSNSDGAANLAPMGAIPDSEAWERFELRPFSSSRTLENLKRNKHGVLHLTDDTLLYAQAIVGLWSDWPEMVPAEKVAAMRISDSPQAFEFEVTWMQEEKGRASLQCQVVARHVGKQFGGLCRARAAVIEAAVLVSRRGLVPNAEIARQLEALRTIVERTGGAAETRAFSLLLSEIAAGAEL